MIRKPLLALILALAGTAFSAGLPDLEGKWVRVAERSGDIPKAIEACIAPLNFAVRPIARSRLTKTNKVPLRLEIRSAGTSLGVVYTPGKEWASPADGRALAVTGDEGKAKLSTRMVGNTLVQHFEGEDGAKTNRFTVSPDGKELTMDTRATSPRLPDPLLYRNVYRREP